MYDKLLETSAFLAKYNSSKARVGVILGSGLGNFVDELQIDQEVAYETIPNFPVSTVKGHSGKLIFGSVGGKAVIAMSGRFHYYEGYSPEEVVFPIRVMKLLGVETVLISNAAGGVNARNSGATNRLLRVGDLMIIKDHISFAIINPLLGKNDDRIGTRFPDMSEPYKKELIDKAKAIANRLSIDLREGVYFGVTGPTFETRAEYQLISVLGADAVGMSTVQEVIAANHAGMNVFAMSVITDIGTRDEENEITHEEVLQAAKDAEPKFSAMFRELIQEIG